MVRRTAVGIDLGTTDVYAANVGRKGVDIVQNAVSERRTPALVSFTDRRRLIGDAAFAQVRSNYRNSCRGLKHLIGRALDSPELQTERFWSLCPLNKASDGTAGYEVSYRGDKMCISATVCLSMLLAKIVSICQAWTKMDVQDIVLAIPSYFPESHRQACLDAVHVAGLQCLRLLHESTAIALAWRFERVNFDDAKPATVAFCSCGHSGLMVAIARFEKGAVAILGEAYDRTVGGRSMDRVILDLFAESLKKQGAPDPLANTKSKLKLEEAATKVKKTLSVVDEARGTAECVIEDYDLSCDVKRDVFEKRCEPLIEKTQAVALQALQAAGLKADDLTHVELVGGASRVPWVQRAVREAFGGKELSTTLNADEAVARGCAWQAAMLSPLIRLSHIPLKEFGHWAIALEWAESPDVEVEDSIAVEGGRRRLLVFEANAGPNVEAEVALRCRGKFEIIAVSVAGERDLPPGVDPKLGTWTLAFPKKTLEDVEIHCAVDLNGVFSVTKAAVCTKKEAPKPQANKDGAETTPEGEENSAKTQETSDAKPEEGSDKKASGDQAADKGSDKKASGDQAADKAPQKEDTSKEPEAEAPKEGTPETGAKEDSADTAGTAEEDGDNELPTDIDGPAGVDPKKPWFSKLQFWKWGRGGDKEGDADAPAGWARRRKIGGKGGGGHLVAVDIAVKRRCGYSDALLKSAVQAEKAYRTREEAVIQAENKRNDFETKIFSLRERMNNKDDLIVEYSSPEEQSELSKELEAAEEWAYEHTDEEASVYTERLKVLQKKEDTYANRKKDLEEIQDKVKNLKTTIRRYKASATAPNYDHIAKDKLDSIIAECDSNTRWLADLEGRHAAQKKWEAPVLSLAELTVRTSSLNVNSVKILKEPRPKPPEQDKEKDQQKDKEDDKGKDKDKEKDAEGKDTSAKDGKSKKSKGDNKDANDAKENKAEPRDTKDSPSSSSDPAPKRSFFRGHRLMLSLGGVALLTVGTALLGFGDRFGAPFSLPGFSQQSSESQDFVTEADGDDGLKDLTAEVDGDDGLKDLVSENDAEENAKDLISESDAEEPQTDS